MRSFAEQQRDKCGHLSMAAGSRPLARARSARVSQDSVELEISMRGWRRWGAAKELGRFWLGWESIPVVVARAADWWHSLLRPLWWAGAGLNRRPCVLAVFRLGAVLTGDRQTQWVGGRVTAGLWHWVQSAARTQQSWDVRWVGREKSWPLARACRNSVGAKFAGSAVSLADWRRRQARPGGALGGRSRVQQRQARKKSRQAALSCRAVLLTGGPAQGHNHYPAMQA